VVNFCCGTDAWRAYDDLLDETRCLRFFDPAPPQDHRLVFNPSAPRAFRRDHKHSGKRQQQTNDFSAFLVRGTAILAAKRQFYGRNQPDLNFFLLKPNVTSDRLTNNRVRRRSRAKVAQRQTGIKSMTGALGNRLARCTLGACVVASSLLAAAASNAGSPRYDGLWSVSIVTEKGDCDRGYRYPIRITHGTLANGGSDPFAISGRVTSSGAITVTVSHGEQSATGSGRLAGNGGIGYWHGGACSGSWTAERRSS
jgi:hypothetical protein